MYVTTGNARWREQEHDIPVVTLIPHWSAVPVVVCDKDWGDDPENGEGGGPRGGPSTAGVREHV